MAESEQPFADLNNFIAKFDPILELTKGARDALLAIREAEARGKTLALEVADREKALTAAKAKLSEYERGISDRIEDAERRAKTRLAQIDQEVDAALVQRDVKLKAIDGELTAATNHKEELLRSLDAQVANRQATLVKLLDQVVRAEASLVELRTMVTKR